MGLFGAKRQPLPQLTREESLSARPVLNRLVKVERAPEGTLTLQVPRRDTALARAVARIFGMTPYRRVALDEIGTFVIELSDGEHTVRQIVDELARRFRLNRREAELSTTAFLRSLAQRSVVGLVIESRRETR